MIEYHSRRTFLKTVSAASLAGLFPASGFSQDLAGTIIKRAIPGTGEMMPLVGFGSSAAVMEILNNGPAQLTGLLEVMVKLGASVIDTAPREPAIDEAFGKLVADARFKDKLFVNTKIGRNRAMNLRSLDKQAGIDQIHQIEQQFNRKPTDLLQIDSLLDMDIHWPTLRDAKANGEARYIGATTSDTDGHEPMEAFMKRDKPDFVQVNFSLLEPDADMGRHCRHTGRPGRKLHPAHTNTTKIKTARYAPQLLVDPDAQVSARQPQGLAADHQALLNQPTRGQPSLDPKVHPTQPVSSPKASAPALAQPAPPTQTAP